MAKLLSLLTGFLALPAVIVAVVEPFISLPGNTTVIAFIDLHRSYHDNNTCGDPDWRSFELAYSLEWRTSLNQGSGSTSCLGLLWEKGIYFRGTKNKYGAQKLIR